MDDNLRHHAGQEKLEQAVCELEAGPVVAELHDLQAVTLERNLSSEILLMESLHGDLDLALVLDLVLLLVELEVLLNWLPGELALFILARRELGHDSPETDEDGDSCQEEEEQVCLQATANLPLQVEGNTEEETKESRIGEGLGSWALSRERGIFDSRRLQLTSK